MGDIVSIKVTISDGTETTAAAELLVPPGGVVSLSVEGELEGQKLKVRPKDPTNGIARDADTFSFDIVTADATLSGGTICVKDPRPGGPPGTGQ